MNENIGTGTGTLGLDWVFRCGRCGNEYGRRAVLRSLEMLQKAQCVFRNGGVTCGGCVEWVNDRAEVKGAVAGQAVAGGEGGWPKEWVYRCGKCRFVYGRLGGGGLKNAFETERCGRVVGGVNCAGVVGWYSEPVEALGMGGGVPTDVRGRAQAEVPYRGVDWLVGQVEKLWAVVKEMEREMGAVRMDLDPAYLQGRIIELAKDVERVKGMVVGRERGTAAGGGSVERPAAEVAAEPAREPGAAVVDRVVFEVEQREGKDGPEKRVKWRDPGSPRVECWHPALSAGLRAERIDAVISLIQRWGLEHFFGCTAAPIWRQGSGKMVAMITQAQEGDESVFRFLSLGQRGTDKMEQRAMVQRKGISTLADVEQSEAEMLIALGKTMGFRVSVESLKTPPVPEKPGDPGCMAAWRREGVYDVMTRPVVEIVSEVRSADATDPNVLKSQVGRDQVRFVVRDHQGPKVVEHQGAWYPVESDGPPKGSDLVSVVLASGVKLGAFVQLAYDPGVRREEVAEPAPKVVVEEIVPFCSLCREVTPENDVVKDPGGRAHHRKCGLALDLIHRSEAEKRSGETFTPESAAEKGPELPKAVLFCPLCRIIVDTRPQIVLTDRGIRPHTRCGASLIRITEADAKQRMEEKP